MTEVQGAGRPLGTPRTSWTHRHEAPSYSGYPDQQQKGANLDLSLVQKTGWNELVHMYLVMLAMMCLHPPAITG